MNQKLQQKRDKMIEEYLAEANRRSEIIGELLLEAIINDEDKSMGLTHSVTIGYTGIYDPNEHDPVIADVHYLTNCSQTLSMWFLGGDEFSLSKLDQYLKEADMQFVHNGNKLKGEKGSLKVSDQFLPYQVSSKTK